MVERALEDCCSCAPPAVEVTSQRVEIKIPVPVSLLPDVLAWVRVHPAHWRKAYPRRQVNNVYFDSPTLEGLNANLGGIGERAKLRLRWYGTELGRILEGQLELKRKRGTTGWKEITHLHLPLDLAGRHWAQVLSELGCRLPDRAAHWLHCFPLPVLINSYQREYFATPDGQLRLTVDDTLAAYDQRASAAPNLWSSLEIGSEVVVELKAPIDTVALRRLNDALACFPISASRFSKYVNGVLASASFGY